MAWACRHCSIPTTYIFIYIIYIYDTLYACLLYTKKYKKEIKIKKKLTTTTFIKMIHWITVPLYFLFFLFLIRLLPAWFIIHCCKWHTWQTGMWWWMIWDIWIHFTCWWWIWTALWTVQWASFRRWRCQCWAMWWNMRTNKWLKLWILWQHAIE